MTARTGILANQAQNGGKLLMHRVWETSSALISLISNKILGIKESGTETTEDSKRRAQKALDSAKIEIKLFSAEGDTEGLRHIAESTNESEIASYAVLFLLEQDSDVVIQILQYLANGNSLASLPALISLFNTGHIEAAQSILLRRLQNGEFFELLRQKKGRALLFLDILGAFDEFNRSTLCYENFPTIWRCLDGRPEEQEYLLAEILGDLNPGGLRYSPDKNMIPQSVKIQALQLLHALKPASYERTLWYASRDEDDVVAYTATMACTDHWQNEGSVPQDLEPFPMLNLNLLFYLSKLASTFQWRGPSGAMETYMQWNKDIEELELMDAKAKPLEYGLLKKNIEVTRKQLVETTEQRLNSLQPIVDAVTNSLGLPHAKIRSTDVPGVAAAYLVGTGTVEFSKTTLLDDKPLTEEFMSSMLHELGHMEQDVLIIRMISDEIGLKFGQHGEKLKILFQQYSDAIGYAPDSIFLLEVLRLRRDRPLTEAERKRAQRLVQAAYENISLSQNAKKISERTAHMEESIAALESGSLDLHLMDCLRDEQSLKPLFDNGHVPAVLIGELRNCRSGIEAIVAQIQEQPGAGGMPASSGDSGVGRAASRNTQRGVFGRKADVISLAQQIHSQGGSDEIALVVERFRIVISQLLSEELRRLDGQLSEIRRAGYHEAEAYTISDRVEVIVKSLRKGWYEFTAQTA